MKVRIGSSFISAAKDVVGGSNGITIMMIVCQNLDKSATDNNDNNDDQERATDICQKVPSGIWWKILFLMKSSYD